VRFHPRCTSGKATSLRVPTVERVGVQIPLLVGRAAGKLLHLGEEGREVEISHMRFRVEGGEVHPMEVPPFSGHPRDESELVDLDVVDDLDPDVSGSLPFVREDESPDRPPRRDLHRDRDLEQVVCDAPVAAGSPPSVEHVGHLVGREVGRVGADGEVPGALFGQVLDLHPDRPDALLLEVDAEVPAGLLPRERDGRHAEVRVLLRLDPQMKRGAHVGLRGEGAAGRERHGGEERCRDRSVGEQGILPERP
jgi:hypothetical protein